MTGWMTQMLRLYLVQLKRIAALWLLIITGYVLITGYYISGAPEMLSWPFFYRYYQQDLQVLFDTGLLLVPGIFGYMLYTDRVTRSIVLIYSLPVSRYRIYLMTCVSLLTVGVPMAAATAVSLSLFDRTIFPVSTPQAGIMAMAVHAYAGILLVLGIGYIVGAVLSSIRQQHITVGTALIIGAFMLYQWLSGLVSRASLSGEIFVVCAGCILIACGLAVFERWSEV